MQCRLRKHQKGKGGGGVFCVDFDACVREVRTRRKMQIHWRKEGGGTLRTAKHGQSTCNVPEVSSHLSDKFSLCLYTLICRLIIHRVHTYQVRCEEQHDNTFLRDDRLCYLEPGSGRNNQN